MRLCKDCAYPVGFFTLACGRCGMRFPHLRSAPPRTLELRLPRWMAAGRGCPHCGISSRRRRTPLLLRPLKGVFGERFSYRKCERCGWSGPSFHGPVEPAEAVGPSFADAGEMVSEPGLARREAQREPEERRARSGERARS